MDQTKPLIVGIAGGTGSGKTTLAQKITETLGDEQVALIDADSYYHDLSHLPLHQRHQINFDHPDALDTPLLKEHIETLKQGFPIKKHHYDFSTHTRTNRHITIHPKSIILVEGILIFALEAVSNLFNLKIFIEDDADIRLLRRILRDVKERGRSIEMITEQYLKNVRPMHEKFVEPSKRAADIVIHNCESVEKVINVLQEKLKGLKRVKLR